MAFTRIWAAGYARSMKRRARPWLFGLVVGGVSLGGSLRVAPPVTFAGGDDSALEKAVVIKGGNEETGVHAEYAYLAQHFPGYEMGQQSVSSKDKHSYYTLEFTTARGEKKTVYFDITGFYRFHDFTQVGGTDRRVETPFGALLPTLSAAHAPL